VWLVVRGCFVIVRSARGCNRGSGGDGVWGGGWGGVVMESVGLGGGGGGGQKGAWSLISSDEVISTFNVMIYSRVC